MQGKSLRFNAGRAIRFSVCKLFSVMQLALQRDVAWTSFALSSKVLFIPTLDVYPEGENLILRGVIHSPKEHKTLEDKAKKIAGDIPLKCQLHYRK